MPLPVIGQILPVKLPVSVQVTNNRLACFQLCLQLLVVILLLFFFFVNRMYVKVLMPDGKVNAWSGKDSTKYAAAVVEDNNNVDKEGG